MRERSQIGCKKKNKKERRLSKEVNSSRGGMDEWTNKVGRRENQRKKQNILREVKKENTQNSFFERLLFYAFGFQTTF